VNGADVQVGGTTAFANSGYLLANNQNNQFNGLVLNKVFSSTQSCSTSDGFSLSFGLLLSAFSGTQVHADSFTLSFVDSRFYSSSWTSTNGVWNLPAHSYEGVNYPKVP
jgi:hypothetical protein